MSISSGGSGAPLGNAVGKITLDVSGVSSAVAQAVSVLERLKVISSTITTALEGIKAAANGTGSSMDSAKAKISGASTALGEAKVAANAVSVALDGAKKSADAVAAADEGVKKSADGATAAKKRKKKAADDAAIADTGEKKSTEGVAVADEGAKKSADGAAAAKTRKKKATEGAAAADESAKKSADGAATASEKVKRSAEGAAAGLDKKKKSAGSAATATDGVKKAAEGATTALDGMKGGASRASAALEGVSRVATVAAAALGAAVVAGLAAAGAAIVALGIRSIQAGSDVEEMMSKYSVVFGQYANQVAGDLKTLADDVGRNRYELMGFASTFQDTFVPLGFARGAAADLSVGLTQLTVDLASFNNVAEPQVLADLQAAIVGNHETMRKYGVIITETTLGQQLLAMGIEGGIAAATEQEKVMARLAIITAGTKDAFGDAARTAGGFANQMRGLKSSVQETIQSIGVNLLPLATRFIATFRAIEPALSRILAGVFAILKNMVEVVLQFIESLARSMGIDFDNLAGNAETWGSNIVTMLANGMAAAASAVISVLADLGSMIAYWLAPGSPPRLLPNLPEWGASAMTEFMNGWASGDFSVFDQIFGTVEQAIRNLSEGLPETDIINNLIGSREAIAQAIEQMRTVGSVTEETMNAIVAGAGPAADAVRAYVEAMLQSEGAIGALEKAQSQLQAIQDITSDNFRTWAGDINSSLLPAVNAYRQALGQVETMEQGLARAQATLQAIQDVSVDNWRQMANTVKGNVSPAMQAHLNALRQLEQANTAYEQAQARVNAVTQKYDALLAPLNAQLKALRDTQTAAAEDDQLTRLNEDINSGWLTGAELREAIAQRDTILLQRRIRETEAQRDAEVGAAKATKDAAEEAQESAEQRAEATRQAALDIARAEVEAMEKARDAAVATAEAQREAMIAAAESQIEIAQAQVDALDEQIARNDAIIRQMQEEIRLQKELAESMKVVESAGGAGGAGGAKPKVGGAGGIKPPAGGPGGGSIFDRLKEALNGGGAEGIEGRFDKIFGDVSKIFGPIQEQAKALGQTWGDVTSRMEKAWARVKKQIGAFQNEFNFEGIKEKFQPFLDGIEPLRPAFESVFNAIREKVVLFGQFIGEQAAKIKTWASENEGLITNFLGVVGTIVGGIVTVVSFIYTNLTGIFDIVLVILDGVITQILNFVTLFMQVVTGDWAGAWQTVKTIIFDALMNMQNLLGAFFNWIAEIFGSSWEEITTTLDGWAANLTAIFQMLGVRISEGWNALWTGLALTLEALGVAIRTGWEALWTGVSLTAEAVWIYMREGWNAFWTGLTLTLEAIGTAVKVGWEALWTGISLTVQAIWQYLVTGWNAFWTGLTTTLTAIGAAISTGWTALWTGVSLTAQALWSAIRDYVKTKLGEVKASVETIVGQVKDWWATTWGEIKTKAETIFSEIKTSIETKLGEIKAVIETKINEAKTWIETQKAAFQTAGENIILGLKDGILAKAGEIIAAALGLVGQVVGAVTGALQEESPSKVFMRIGSHAGEGLAIGITNSASLAVDSAKRMANAVIGAMRPLESALSFDKSLVALNQAKKFAADTTDTMSKVRRSFDMVNWAPLLAAANNSAMRGTLKPSFSNSSGLMGPVSAGLDEAAIKLISGAQKSTHMQVYLTLPNVTDGQSFLQELTDLGALMG